MSGARSASPRERGSLASGLYWISSPTIRARAVAADRPPPTTPRRAGSRSRATRTRCVRDLMLGDLSLRAMSLVYTTMLAIVPLLAFCFSLLKGLGFHRDLEPLLNNFLSPLGPRSGELTQRIIELRGQRERLGAARRQRLFC